MKWRAKWERRQKQFQQGDDWSITSDCWMCEYSVYRFNWIVLCKRATNRHDGSISIEKTAKRELLTGFCKFRERDEIIKEIRIDEFDKEYVWFGGWSATFRGGTFAGELVQPWVADWSETGGHLTGETHFVGFWIRITTKGLANWSKMKMKNQ